ncbi:hypothetical protein FQA39_LY07404 [Lamprigera yunnana]|nr:hypothetical protein FQA39_LY07404 [Lamprigera yunnana]
MALESSKDHSHIHSHNGHDVSVRLGVLLGIVEFLVVAKSTKDEAAKPNVENEKIKVAGYLNLATDFSHYVTDGLTIGASYIAGKSVVTDEDRDIETSFVFMYYDLLFIKFSQRNYYRM